MTPFSTTTRWTLGLLAACLLMTAILWATLGWVHLGVAPINAERSPWSDTAIHLATAVNCVDNLGEWHGRVCFVPTIDSIPRAQTYEPWLTIHRLGADDINDIVNIAVGMVVAFCVAFAFSLRPRSGGEAILGLAIFSTSAVQLAIERGNFDLLIAAMICLAGLLLARPRASSAIGGILFLSIATMLKLYTGLACLLAGFIARIPWRVAVPASIAAVALAVFVIGPRELLILGGGAPEGATRFSTGSRWLFLHAGTAWGIGAIALALGAMWVAWQSLSPPATAPDYARWPRRIAVFQIAFLTAIPLFLLKDSYDYRFVLWLPCLALPFAWLRSGAVDPGWRRFSIVLIGLFVFVAGIELPCTWLDALARDTGANWLVDATTGLTYAKQFGAWLLTGLLAVLFAKIVQARATDRFGVVAAR